MCVGGVVTYVAAEVLAVFSVPNENQIFAVSGERSRHYVSVVSSVVLLSVCDVFVRNQGEYLTRCDIALEESSKCLAILFAPSQLKTAVRVSSV